METILSPWPWYVVGPLIGFTVPALLILGNKIFGISSSFRHICAAVLPAKIPFFQYNWKKESWNLFFVAGITIGAFIANVIFPNPEVIKINPDLVATLKAYQIDDFHGLMPTDLFSFPSLFTVRGFVMMIGGGFLVGFGTRWAGGCTSGHAISGISNLQMPSLIATCCFMAGGFVMSNLILPFILNL